MDQLWLDLFKQAPGIAAVIFLVVIFLKFMEKTATDLKNTFQEIRDSCHSFHSESTKDTHATINSCSVALSENSKQLGRASYLIDKYAANGKV